MLGVPCSDYYQTYTTEAFTTALGGLDNVHKHRGVCVECRSTKARESCDCGLDEYCGYDHEDAYDKDTSEWTFEYKVTVPAGITSLNIIPGGGMPVNIKKRLEAYAKQFEGLPIKSKCKKYSTSHMGGVCNPDGFDTSTFAKMVEESLMTASKNQWLDTCTFTDDDRQQRRMVKRFPMDTRWPKDAQGALVLWCESMPFPSPRARSSLSRGDLTFVACVCAQIASADASYPGGKRSMRSSICPQKQISTAW